MVNSWVVQSVPHSACSEASYRDDVARKSLLELHVVHSEPLLNPQHLGLALDFAALTNCVDFVAHRNRARCNPSNKHFAEVLVGFSLSHEHFQVSFRVKVWLRDGGHHCIQQVFDTLARFLKVVDGPAVLCSCVDDWVLQLVVAGIQVAEQVEDFVFNFRNAT